jgi:hypothetical protein
LQGPNMQMLQFSCVKQDLDGGRIINVSVVDVGNIATCSLAAC